MSLWPSTGVEVRSTRLLAIKGHGNLTPLPLHREFAGHERPAGLMLPRRRVEVPAVPGAGDDAALQFPFAQRPPLMRTDAVKGTDGSAEVEEGNDAVAGDALQRCAGGKVAFSGSPMPVGHASIV